METRLFPEKFAYDAITSSPMIEDRRTYTFVETLEGTKIIIEGGYAPRALRLKLLDKLGLVEVYTSDAIRR